MQPIDQVRLLIPDTDPDNRLFSDVEIQTFLDMEDQSVRLAAATALSVLASNEALVAKVIRTQDLQTDGPKVSAELRARAAELRQQDDDAADRASGGLMIVDFDPSYRGSRAELTGWSC